MKFDEIQFNFNDETYYIIWIAQLTVMDKFVSSYPEIDQGFWFPSAIQLLFFYFTQAGQK